MRSKEKDEISLPNSHSGLTTSGNAGQTVAVTANAPDLVLTYNTCVVKTLIIHPAVLKPCSLYYAMYFHVYIFYFFMDACFIYFYVMLQIHFMNFIYFHLLSSSLKGVLMMHNIERASGI